MGCVQSLFNPSKSRSDSPEKEFVPPTFETVVVTRQPKKSSKNSGETSDEEAASGCDDFEKCAADGDGDDRSLHLVEATAVRTLAANTGSVAILGTTAKCKSLGGDASPPDAVPRPQRTERQQTWPPPPSDVAADAPPGSSQLVVETRYVEATAVRKLAADTGSIAILGTTADPKPPQPGRDDAETASVHCVEATAVRHLAAETGTIAILASTAAAAAATDRAPRRRSSDGRDELLDLMPVGVREVLDSEPVVDGSPVPREEQQGESAGNEGAKKEDVDDGGKERERADSHPQLIPVPVVLAMETKPEHRSFDATFRAPSFPSPSGKHGLPARSMTADNAANAGDGPAAFDACSRKTLVRQSNETRERDDEDDGRSPFDGWTPTIPVFAKCPPAKSKSLPNKNSNPENDDGQHGVVRGSSLPSDQRRGRDAQQPSDSAERRADDEKTVEPVAVQPNRDELSPNETNDKRHAVVEPKSTEQNAIQSKAVEPNAVQLNSVESEDEPKGTNWNSADFKDEPKGTVRNSVESEDEPKGTNRNSVEFKDEPKGMIWNSVESKDEPKGTNRNSVESEDEPRGTNRNSVESEDEPKGTNWNSAEFKDEPKGTNRNSAELKDEPKGTNRNSVESEDEPKGTNRNSAELKDEPKGTNRNSAVEPDAAKAKRNERLDAVGPEVDSAGPVGAKGGRDPVEGPTIDGNAIAVGKTDGKIGKAIGPEDVVGPEGTESGRDRDERPTVDGKIREPSATGENGDRKTSADDAEAEAEYRLTMIQSVREAVNRICEQAVEKTEEIVKSGRGRVSAVATQTSLQRERRDADDSEISEFSLPPPPPMPGADSASTGQESSWPPLPQEAEEERTIAPGFSFDLPDPPTEMDQMDSETDKLDISDEEMRATGLPSDEEDKTDTETAEDDSRAGRAMSATMANGTAAKADDGTTVAKAAKASASADDRAATTIQAVYRGFRARKHVEAANAAAAKIQAGFRGYRVRRSLRTSAAGAASTATTTTTDDSQCWSDDDQKSVVSVVAAEASADEGGGGEAATAEEEAAALTEAAVKIQARVRGFAARKRLNEEKNVKR